MNKLTHLLLTLAVSGSLFAVSASAQTATTNNSSSSASPASPSGAGPGVVDPGHPRVNQVNHREGHQQACINNGVQHGTLTNKQASRLETRETALQNREQADMNKHNGHLTKSEQAGLNRQENRISRSIRHDKEATTLKKASQSKQQ